jgi:hypothetical protein
MSHVDDLAGELKTNYNGASKSQKVVQIHLFGIRRAAVLKGVSLPDLLARAGMPDSYKTEIRKGMRLAEHVEEKR